VKTKSSWRPNSALSISIAESATGTRETIPPESYEVADLPLAYTEARSGLGYVQKCALGAGYIHQSFLALPGGFLPRAFENKNCVEIEMETAWRVILAARMEPLGIREVVSTTRTNSVSRRDKCYGD